ncbi:MULTISPECIES: hypothetical protein [Kordiimonas]|jgi:hypothetical membrane protein|uniref:hypothetical protein n=1 Tax=Kordiimonas TaxID=288021 RepID=UPI002580685E|nr:hypothetical protein [Kordiimonas sp. UBA4487]
MKPEKLSNVRIKVWLLSVYALGAAALMLVGIWTESDQLQYYGFGAFFLVLILAWMIRCEGCGQFWAHTEDDDNDYKMFIAIAKKCPKCGMTRR